MKHLLYLIIIALTGCATPPPPSTVVHVSADLPPASDKPWSEGRSTTYWISRTVAGADGNVINEAHPLYRLEEAGHPQLATPPGLFYPSGSQLPATNATYEEYEALRSEAARARDVTLKLARAAQDLAQQSAAMRITAENNRLTQQQLGQLLQTALILSNRVQTLELRTLPAEASQPVKAAGELPTAHTYPQTNQ
jgi:hypothetical protein